MTAHDGTTASAYATGSNGNRMSLLRQAARERGGEYESGKQTIGWAPACTCNAGEPMPAIVLDPFSGSGTTVAVAVELGRVGIGVDIAPEYNEQHGMARLERTQPALIAAGMV